MVRVGPRVEAAGGVVASEQIEIATAEEAPELAAVPEADEGDSAAASHGFRIARRATAGA